MSLEVTYLDHVSVVITDVERSRRFYGELLGLREIWDFFRGRRGDNDA